MLTYKTELGYIPIARMEDIRNKAKEYTDIEIIEDQMVVDFVGVMEHEEGCRHCDVGDVDSASAN